MRDQQNRMFPTAPQPGFAPSGRDQPNRMFGGAGFMGDFGPKWNPYTQPPAPPPRLGLPMRRPPIQPMSGLPGVHQMPGGGFMEGPSHVEQPMMFQGRR